MLKYSQRLRIFNGYWKYDKEGSMAAALSLFTIVFLSVVFARIGSVALRLTGLPAHVAQFQARSAFSVRGLPPGNVKYVIVVRRFQKAKVERRRRNDADWAACRTQKPGG